MTAFRPRRASGFTMIELLAALSVATILVAVGVPSYQRFIANQRIKTAASALNYTLLFARSEAIKRNAVVAVTPIDDCWQDGWEITVGGVSLAREAGYPELSIAAAESPPESLSFNADGRVEGSTSPFQITSPGSSEITPRCISVDLSGLPATRSAACTTPVASCS